MEDNSTQPYTDLAQEALVDKEKDEAEVAAANAGIGAAAKAAMPAPIQEKQYDTQAELAGAQRQSAQNRINALIYKAFDKAIVGISKSGGGTIEDDNLTSQNLWNDAQRPVHNLKDKWQQRATELKETRARREAELKDPTSEINQKFQEKAQPWLDKLGAGHVRLTIDDINHPKGIHAGLTEAINRQNEGSRTLLYSGKMADLQRNYAVADAKAKAEAALAVKKAGRRGGGGGGGFGGIGKKTIDTSPEAREQYMAAAEASGVKYSDLDRHNIMTMSRDGFTKMVESAQAASTKRLVEDGATEDNPLEISTARNAAINQTRAIEKETIKPSRQLYREVSKARQAISQFSQAELDLVTVAMAKAQTVDKSGNTSVTFSYAASKLLAAAREQGLDPQSEVVKNAQTLASQLASINAFFVKSISGAQASNGEREFLKFAMSMQPGANKEALVGRLNAVFQGIEQDIITGVQHLSDRPELQKQLLANTPFQHLLPKTAKDTTTATPKDKARVMVNGSWKFIPKEQLSKWKEHYKDELSKNPDKWKASN